MANGMTWVYSSISKPSRHLICWPVLGSAVQNTTDFVALPSLTPFYGLYGHLWKAAQLCKALYSSLQCISDTQKHQVCWPGSWFCADRTELVACCSSWQNETRLESMRLHVLIQFGKFSPLFESTLGLINGYLSSTTLLVYFLSLMSIKFLTSYRLTSWLPTQSKQVLMQCTTWWVCMVFR